jgi:hypothetical protein
MRNKIKKLPLLTVLLALLFFASGNLIKSSAANTIPDYSGNWDFFFYDASGKLQGKKTIFISESGSVSDKVILNLDNVIYNTEISCALATNGKVIDGNLTDTDKLEMVGVLTGNFTELEGNGTWTNYYKKSGTWKASRSTKQDKRG